MIRSAPQSGEPNRLPFLKALRLRSGRRTSVVMGAATVCLVAVGLVVWLSGDSRPPVRLAFVAGLTGANGSSGRDMLQGVQLQLAEANRSGGVKGRRVELDVYDDRDDPTVARQRAEEIAADARVLAVIGHRTSGASLAAGPVYARAGIPVVTPTSTADAVTESSPTFFRMVFTNTAEGAFISSYLRGVLQEHTVLVVAGTDDYSRTLSDGVLAGLPSGERPEVLILDTSSPPPAEAVESLARRAKALVGSGTVVVALPEAAARAVVPALRRAEFRGRIFGGDAIGSDEFFQSVSALSGDGMQESDFTDDLYATAPLISDALTGDGVRWYSLFVSTFGRPPTWRAATSYQSALVLLHALRAPAVNFRPGEVSPDRSAVLAALSQLDSPERSVHGVTGPIWFDGSRSTVMPITVGVGRNGHFVSAFDQLQPAPQPTPETAGRLGDEGVVVGPGGARYERKRVVTVGTTVNLISALDAETFQADFFLWLKFSGDDDVTDLEFPNSVDPAATLGEPVRVSTRDGVSYRLYRVTGSFRASLEFHDFPFDRQELSIEVQHRSLPSSRVVYAVDIDALSASQRERLTSGVNAAEPVLAVPDWVADRLDYFQSTVGAVATLGDPTLRGGQTGLNYSRFVSRMTIHRDLRPFLVKNLLPLLLLASATYSSLYFSHSQTAERVAFGATGILTGAVLLAEVTSALPNVGYTVAIQWGYYVFILLAAGCVIVGIAGDGYYEKGRSTAVRRLDLASRIVFPATAIATVLVYVLRFH